MKYISTRGNAPVLSFEDAMLTGLARDGGLYLPETIPQLSHADIAAMAGLPYEEIAFRVMQPFVGDSFSEAELLDAITAAYSGFGHAARAPLVQLGPNHYLLELFHGPTLAFKDFAMQLIGQLFQKALGRRGEQVTIVGATSGDTGSAAIEAFRGLDAVKLAGVNSINWARVLAQVVYYFSSATALGAPHRKVSFTVPTGNFGDIFAGYIAKQMGLPIDRLVIATNRNDILHRAISTGRYDMDTVFPTITPSMDIQVSSNFERALFYAYDRDGGAVAQLMGEMKQGGFGISQGALGVLRSHFDSGCSAEEATSATMKTMFETTGEVLCPHSAVGVKVALDHLGGSPMITLATAHPAKFPDAVEAAMGVRPVLPRWLADLFDLPERLTEMPNDLQHMKSLIRERIAL